MKRKNFSVAVANVVMETVSELQKNKQSAAMKDIREHIYEKYGHRAEKFLKLVPRYVNKGVNLGIIAKYGDHYRTKMYVAKRRKGGSKGKKRRRRRRH
ncbi:hypothetical protein Zmor_012500 [Zophobas morio]|uniref:Uncharacterized protein n=1 Tax=Zophobas morio TaxID=2755281 RepID=A0AA38IDF9_9CUCU|nr:hypothetical protein Zmor_012500 [Zophobas morio]